MTDLAAQAIVSSLLEPGERIVWLEKPEPWAIARRHAFPLVFLAVWTGALLTAAWNDLFFPKPNQNNPGFALTVIPLMLSFSTIFWYKFLTQFLSSWHTIYALTDRRIIVAAGNETLSYRSEHLGDIWRGMGDAKRGSLNFWGRAWRVKRFGGFPDKHYPHGLFGIADPGRVKALIHETLIKPQNRGNAT